MVKRTAAGAAAFGTVLALLLVTLTAVHASTQPAKVTAAAPVWLRVMPLGDSITDGGSVSTRASYRLPLWNIAATESAYGLDFVGSVRSGSVADADHEGHSGFMIDDIRARIARWIAAADPDVVLLHIGINDLNNGKASGASDRLALLVNEIYAVKPSAVIILAGLIPSSAGLGDDVAAYNARARLLPAAAQRDGHRLRYVDMPLTSAELVDDLHPNEAGYRRMASVFAAAIAGTVADGGVGRRRDSLAEQYGYPHQVEILQTRNIKLNFGDGHILVADCDAAPAAGAGLLEVISTTGPEQLCFQIRAPGVLDLVVPGLVAFHLVRAGTGSPAVTAQMWTADGVATEVTVPPDGSYVAVPEDGNPVLSRLRVAG